MSPVRNVSVLVLAGIGGRVPPSDAQQEPVPGSDKLQAPGGAPAKRVEAHKTRADPASPLRSPHRSACDAAAVVRPPKALVSAPAVADVPAEPSSQPAAEPALQPLPRVLRPADSARGTADFKRPGKRHRVSLADAVAVTKVQHPRMGSVSAEARQLETGTKQQMGCIGSDAAAASILPETTPVLSTSALPAPQQEALAASEPEPAPPGSRVEVPRFTPTPAPELAATVAKRELPSRSVKGKGRAPDLLGLPSADYNRALGLKPQKGATAQLPQAARTDGPAAATAAASDEQQGPERAACRAGVLVAVAANIQPGPTGEGGDHVAQQQDVATAHQQDALPAMTARRQLLHRQARDRVIDTGELGLDSTGYNRLMRRKREEAAAAVRHPPSASNAVPSTAARTAAGGRTAAAASQDLEPQEALTLRSGGRKSSKPAATAASGIEHSVENSRKAQLRKRLSFKQVRCSSHPVHEVLLACDIAGSYHCALAHHLS